MMRRKVFLTGHTGFLGGSIIKFFNKDSDVEFVKSKIRWPQKYHFDDLAGCDSVIHLAGCAHGKFSNKDELSSTNIEYPKELALRAKSLGIRKFIFVSTVNASKFDTSSNCEDAAVADIQTASKVVAENALLDLSSSNFSVIIVRCPLVYSLDAPANFGMMLRFINKSLIFPFGLMINKGSFLAKDNFCSAIKSIIFSSYQGSDIFELVDDDPLSISDILVYFKRGQGKLYFNVPIPLVFFNIMFTPEKIRRKLEVLSYPLLVDNIKFCKTFKWVPIVKSDQYLMSIGQCINLKNNE